MHQVRIVVSASPQTHDRVSETSWESWSSRAGTRRGGEEVGGAMEGTLLRHRQDHWWTTGADAVLPLQRCRYGAIRDGASKGQRSELLTWSRYSVSLWKESL